MTTRFFLPFLVGASLLQAAPTGPQLYQQHCALCHGQEGRGTPGIFPPLAASDFLVTQRDAALRAPLSGLSGKIAVNGVTYEGMMPPVALIDDEIAAIFAHVYASWGNAGKAPDAAEIALLRKTAPVGTIPAPVTQVASAVLPVAPPGWKLKVATQLSFSPVRVALHPDGASVLILAENGDVWRWPLAGDMPSVLFKAATFLRTAGNPSFLGLTVDRQGRLYIVGNQHDPSVQPVRNNVTILRTNPWSTLDGWNELRPWVVTSYPYGIGPYNHGVSQIAQGPDGWIYANSGSRTDGGERGEVPGYSTRGEEDVTACLWRLDPNVDNPAPEIFARGLRNSFGFCWDDAGRMLATENGPDANAPEELNLIERGHHYGFPFQFSDWDRKPYPYSPETPAGLVITRPFRNLGPAAGGKAAGLSTFEPHSSPSGIAWLDTTWPAPLGGSFVVARFGNLIKDESGFDLLQLHPNFSDRTTTVHTVLKPLGRPVDLLKLPGHRLLVAEYCRGTSLAAGLGTPGRLLMLEPLQPAVH